MFHRGHYNKILEVLGRRIAYEYVYGTEDSYEGTLRVTGGLIVMFQDDNDDFDSEKFMFSLRDKVDDYVAVFSKDGPSLEKFMEKFNENIRSSS